MMCWPNKAKKMQCATQPAMPKLAEARYIQYIHRYTDITESKANTALHNQHNKNQLLLLV